MQFTEEVSPHVSCCLCGEKFPPVVRTEIDGDLLWQFMQCPGCGIRYTITVTDTLMRERLVVLREMSEEGEALSDEEIGKWHRLYDANLLRAIALRKERPLQHQLW